MVSADRKEFGAILAAVYDFWNRELHEMSFEIWWESLKHLDLETVRGALARHMRDPDTGKFIPKPSDVIQHVGGTTADASMLAWSKVMAGVKNYGTYESVAFDDPLIHRVLADLGGWTWLGEQKTDEMPFVERRFRDAYRAWMRSAQLPAYQPHLAGRIEIMNAATGYRDHTPQPKLIGDPARAAAIAGVAFEGQKRLTEAKT